MTRRWSRWKTIFCVGGLCVIYLWIVENPRTAWKQRDPDIRLAEKRQTILDIEWYRQWSRYGVLIVPGFILGIVGLVALSKVWAAQKQASVHTYEVGNSKFAVHEKDLRVAAPLAMGLMTAQQLKEMNAGSAQAFEMYTKMADAQTRQMHALLKGTSAAHTIERALPDAPEPPALTAPQMLTFQQLLEQGILAPGKPMILGYHQGQPEYRTLQNLKSVAVAGWQGSGKTSSAAFLLASCVLAYDVHAYVIDPHKHHDEGLYALIQPLEQTGRVTVVNPFDTPGLIHTFTQRLDRRLRGEESSERGILLVIDELARLAKMDYFDDLVILLERCTEEARKANMTFMGISTKWTARHFKGRADIRACMNSALVHKCKPSQAELLLEDSKEKKLVEQLQRPGEAILLTDYAGAKPVSMPYCTRADMTAVARMIDEATRPIAIVTTHAPTAATPAETAAQKQPCLCNGRQAETHGERGETPTFGEIIRGRLATLLMPDGKPLSQNKLAELTGISKKDMSLYLNGGKPVSEEIRTHIERALNMIAKQGNTLQNQEETDAETDAETLLGTLTPETALVH